MAPRAVQAALLAAVVAGGAELFEPEVIEAIKYNCLTMREAQSCGCVDLESCLRKWGSTVAANKGSDASPLSSYGKPGPFKYQVKVVRADPRVFYGTETGSAFGVGGSGQYVADVVSNITVDGKVIRCRYMDAQGVEVVDFSNPICYTLIAKGKAPMMDQVSEFKAMSEDQPGYPLVRMRDMPVLYVAYPVNESNPDMHYPVFQMSPGTYANAGGYSAYATLMASHGFVAIVPYLYWVPFGTLSMDNFETYSGNTYISQSLAWICEAGTQSSRGSMAYCPLETPETCDPFFVQSQLPGMMTDCYNQWPGGGVALGGHSGGGAWALWAGLNMGINPAYVVKGLMLHEAGLIPGFNAPYKFNWQRGRGSGLKILVMAGRWMTLLQEQHEASYEDPALNGCTGNITRDGSNCAGASPFGWFPPGVEPSFTQAPNGASVNSGQTPNTTTSPDGIFAQWNDYLNKYGGACSDGIGSAGLGTAHAFVVQGNFPSTPTGLPPPPFQNYKVQKIEDTSGYLDGDVVLVGGSWQHITSVSNWLQGANITTLDAQAHKFGTINANGVAYVPMAAKYGVAWAKYIFQGDQEAQAAIFKEGEHTQEYCNLVTCAGFAMPGVGPMFGTFLKRAGGTKAEDIKCVSKKPLIQWRHRGRLVKSPDDIERVDGDLGLALLSEQLLPEEALSTALRLRERPRALQQLVQRHDFDKEPMPQAFDVGNFIQVSAVSVAEKKEL